MDITDSPDGVSGTLSVDRLVNLGTDALDAMYQAGLEIRECERVLAKTGDTVLDDLLRHEGTLESWRHYPDGDVYDRITHAQYYFHLHNENPPPGEQIGHFHTFVRQPGMPEGTVPVAGIASEDPMDWLSHLVAVSVDDQARIVELFCTNAWVTGEAWYKASDVTRMLDSFQIDMAWPSWPANRWITAVLTLFKPQIIDLVNKRDERIVEPAARNPDGLEGVLRDRTVEVLASCPVSIDTQLTVLAEARRELRRQSAASDVSDRR